MERHCAKDLCALAALGLDAELRESKGQTCALRSDLVKKHAAVYGQCVAWKHETGS